MGSRTKEVECAYCHKKLIVPLSRAKDFKYCSRECMRKAYTKRDLPKIGTRINNWEVVSDEIIRKYGRPYIKVKCTCGSEIVDLIQYHHYLDQQSQGCKKCSHSIMWKGYKEIDGNYWSIIQTCARKRGISFDLKIEDIWDLYIKQNRLCAISGAEITFAPSTRKEDLKYRTASLDRIDSNLGYTIDNVQWVHKDVNIMKNKFSQEEFEDFIIKAASKVKLKVKIKRLCNEAKLPQYAHSTDAGLDLVATSKKVEDGCIVYGTGLAFEIPEGYVGLIFPRSSNAKKDLLLSNSVGCVDSGYTGEITFKFKPTKEDGLQNFYKPGDRIGQLIILPYPEIEFEEVKELSDTERGAGGYGSSGN